MDTDIQTLGRRLAGRWTSASTHPAFPGKVIAGSVEVEWLEGEKFLIMRAQVDHPDFPNSISIVGDTDGLRMHYFDSRGVYRLYEVTVDEHSCTMAMDRSSPAHSFAASHAPFSQRLTYTFESGDETMSLASQLSEDEEHWDDDLQATFRRKA